MKINVFGCKKNYIIRVFIFEARDKGNDLINVHYNAFHFDFVNTENESYIWLRS